MTEKDSEAIESQGTVSIRMFGPSTPDESDLITDDMLEEYREVYGTSIKAIALSESVGSTAAKSEENTVSVHVAGVNTDVLISEELNIISGRFIKQRELDKSKKVCVIADTAAEELFGSASNII